MHVNDRPRRMVTVADASWLFVMIYARALPVSAQKSDRNHLSSDFDGIDVQDMAYHAVMRGDMAVSTTRILVLDDGPGAPSDAFATFTGRGVRLGEDVPGAGQRLAIAQDIARAYGGQLKFSNKAKAVFP